MKFFTPTFMGVKFILQKHLLVSILLSLRNIFLKTSLFLLRGVVITPTPLFLNLSSKKFTLPLGETSFVPPNPLRRPKSLHPLETASHFALLIPDTHSTLKSKINEKIFGRLGTTKCVARVCVRVQRECAKHSLW